MKVPGGVRVRGDLTRDLSPQDLAQGLSLVDLTGGLSPKDRGLSLVDLTLSLSKGEVRCLGTASA
jgi:hypothetical protein